MHTLHISVSKETTNEQIEKDTEAYLNDIKKNGVMTYLENEVGCTDSDFASQTMPLSDKVFCSQCHFYHEWYEEMGCGGENCKASLVSRHNYKNRWIEYSDPKQLNKDNNCKYYKPSRWFVLKKKLSFCMSACMGYKEKLKKWLMYPLAWFYHEW